MIFHGPRCPAEGYHGDEIPKDQQKQFRITSGCNDVSLIGKVGIVIGYPYKNQRDWILLEIEGCGPIAFGNPLHGDSPLRPVTN